MSAQKKKERDNNYLKRNTSRSDIAVRNVQSQFTRRISLQKQRKDQKGTKKIKEKQTDKTGIKSINIFTETTN